MTSEHPCPRRQRISRLSRDMRIQIKGVGKIMAGEHRRKRKGDEAEAMPEEKEEVGEEEKDDDDKD